MKETIEQVMNMPDELELKSWGEYSLPEKETILYRWWTSLGKKHKSAAVEDEFLRLLKESPDTIWFVAVMSLLRHKGNEPLILAIETNEVGELLVQAKMNYMMPYFTNDDSTQDIITTAEEHLLMRIVHAYNMDTAEQFIEDAATKTFG